MTKTIAAAVDDTKDAINIISTFSVQNKGLFCNVATISIVLWGFRGDLSVFS